VPPINLERIERGINKGATFNKACILAAGSDS
jgi:hypothetical protein